MEIGQVKGKVVFKYSTPAEYTAAKLSKEANLTWSVKSDDFFPYALLTAIGLDFSPLDICSNAWCVHQSSVEFAKRPDKSNG